MDLTIIVVTHNSFYLTSRSMLMLFPLFLPFSFTRRPFTSFHESLISFTLVVLSQKSHCCWEEGTDPLLGTDRLSPAVTYLEHLNL